MESRTRQNTEPEELQFWSGGNEIIDGLQVKVCKKEEIWSSSGSANRNLMIYCRCINYILIFFCLVVHFVLSFLALLFNRKLSEKKKANQES